MSSLKGVTLSEAVSILLGPCLAPGEETPVSPSRIRRLLGSFINLGTQERGFLSACCQVGPPQDVLIIKVGSRAATSLSPIRCISESDCGLHSGGKYQLHPFVTAPWPLTSKPCRVQSSKFKVINFNKVLVRAHRGPAGRAEVGRREVLHLQPAEC